MECNYLKLYVKLHLIISDLNFFKDCSIASEYFKEWYSSNPLSGNKIDLDELIKLSSRIVVLYRGSIVAMFNRKEFDKTQIGMYMVSGQPN